MGEDDMPNSQRSISENGLRFQATESCVAPTRVIPPPKKQLACAARIRAYALPKDPCMLPPLAPPKKIDLENRVQTVELLRRAHSEMEALAFSASGNDETIDAFESFRRAVTRTVDNGISEAWEALEQMNSKSEILEFLANLSLQRRLYKARVSSVVRRLELLENWRNAMNFNTATCAVSVTQYLQASSRAQVSEC